MRDLGGRLPIRRSAFLGGMHALSKTLGVLRGTLLIRDQNAIARAPSFYISRATNRFSIFIRFFCEPMGDHFPEFRMISQRRDIFIMQDVFYIAISQIEGAAQGLQGFRR